MRRTLAILGLVIALALGAQAQFIGYTSAQSVTSTPFNGSTCTAALAAGDVLVTNIGQGAHFLTATVNASAPTALSYVIQGSYDGTTFFDISDVGTTPVNNQDSETVSGTGYYPVIAVKVLACTPGANVFTLRYSGISLTPGTPVGTAQSGQQLKRIAAGASAGTTFASAAYRAPFGSSSGALEFSYSGSSGPSGSTLQVTCGTTPFISQPAVLNVSLQTGIGPQVFNVGNFPCPYFLVQYSSGGASAATYTLDYAFVPPGSGQPPNSYSHITGTTATAIKATAGTVHTLSINLGAAGTVSIFDLAAAGCTGTPATNQVAIITATATTLQTFTYDVNLINGICVKASAAMDLTVSYQ